MNGLIRDIAQDVNFEKDSNLQLQASLEQESLSREIEQKSFSREVVIADVMYTFEKHEALKDINTIETYDLIELCKQIKDCANNILRLISSNVTLPKSSRINISLRNKQLYEQYELRAWKDRFNMLLWYGDNLYYDEKQYIDCRKFYQSQSN